MKKLNESDICTMLEQAKNAEEFRKQVLANLALMGPWGLNIYNSLQKLYLTDDIMKNYLSTSSTILHESFDLAAQIYPGAVAAYGRRKSFISYLVKLIDYEDVTDVYDHHALRILLDDTDIDAVTSIEYLYVILKGIFDHFYFKRKCLFKPLPYGIDTITDDIRNQLYVPEELPDDLRAFNDFFKDRVRFPKENGFRGISVVIITPDYFPVEIQLWTTSMAYINDFGTACHDENYKPPSKIDKIIYERGGDFLKLKKKTIVSNPLVKNTARRTFPEDLLKQH
ncbi:MAG: hypothetical protein J6J36_04060 [Clostridia bacterium]|nr:hypothetical protein [Clostridia bacterium]